MIPVIGIIMKVQSISESIKDITTRKFSLLGKAKNVTDASTGFVGQEQHNSR